MFERILVAVDGSPASEKTLAVAVDMAKRYGSRVAVAHVREYERFEGDDVDLGPPIPAEQLVEEALIAFRDAGVEAKGTIRRVDSGQTPEQIVEAAKEFEANLIITGSRGMGKLKSLLLGGVANEVVHLATCPVLLVR